MKSISLLILSFTFFYISNAQNPTKEIKVSFLTLRSQLIKKSNATIRLTSYYDASHIDSSLSKDIKKTASDLVKQLNRNTHFDSSYTQLIAGIIGYLNLLISRQEKIALNANINTTKIKTLRLQLEIIENRIVVLKENYNGLCRKDERLDLLLNIEAPDDKNSTIEF